MTHLLHLDSSAQTTGSVSRQLGATFRQALPSATVTHRDLATDPIPHLGPDAIAAAWTPSEFRTPAQSDAQRLREELAAELLAADAVLVTAPMYNLTIPSTLKAWIDQALVADTVLTFGDEPKPLAGKPVTVALSYGGAYGDGSPNAAINHVEPYLRAVFEGMLGMVLTVIEAELTLAPMIPAMASLVPLAEASSATAHAAAAQAAAALGELVAA